MSLESWWFAVRPETRQWLVAHNGEPLPDDVAEEIVRVDGPVASGAWWAARTHDGALCLSDAGVDWVEAVANDEDPPAPPGT